MSDTSKPPKRLNLGRFVREGQAQGRALRRHDALAASTSSTIVDDARHQLEEARGYAKRGTLVDREWVLMTVRGLVGSLSPFEDTRTSEILEEARALKAEIVRRDEEEFAPLRAEVRAGTYGPDRWRDEVLRRPELEREAFTMRLLGLYDPPRPSSARETDMVHFVASTVQDVLDIVDFVGPDDVFYDVGCGTGKVALLVRWLTGATVKGIEYDPAYVAAAERARDELGFDASFEAIDARAVDYADASALYLYEPFRGEVMAGFLERIDTLRRQRTDFFLLARYVVVDGFADVPWLEVTDRRPSGVRRYVPLPPSV